MKEIIGLQKAYTMIKAASGILFVGHLRPDGDALSSLLALELIAKKLGQQSYAFAEQQHPRVFNYLPNFYSIFDNKNELYNNFKEADNWLQSFNLIVVCDCGSLARTAIAKEILDFKKSGGKVIEFDHHPKIDDYADLELRDPSLSSTAELIYNFIIANNIKLDRQLADCILTGIMADTGNFLYPSATDATMKAASAALSAGAGYAKILQAISGGKNFAIMKLWGLILDRVQLNIKYQMAVALVTREEIKEILVNEKLEPALESELFSNLIAFLSNYAGVKAVMLLHEDGNGYVKGSLRSTADGYLVDKLARALGGGGHERAAGFAVYGKLENNNGIWKIVNN